MEAGVRIARHTGVTVESPHWGSSVTGFDAGVAIYGGSGNTVAQVVLQQNGYGVVVYGSDNNTVEFNRFVSNATPVAVLGSTRASSGSSGNVVQGNEVRGSDGTSILVSPIGPNATRQRMANNQVFGNDIVGAYASIVALSARNVTIAENSVGNYGGGIQIGSIPGGLIETGAVVQNNFVNGGNIPSVNGVGIQVNTASDNQVTGNEVRHGGISVVGTSGQPALRNVISGNNVYLGSGIALEQHVHFSQVLNNLAIRNQPFDLSDAGGCGDNTWFGNQWSGGTHPDCVEAGGSPAP